MAWDYSWQVGPKGGTLIPIATYGRARLAQGAELIGGKRGYNLINPYRHGMIAVPHKFNSELLVPLVVTYKAPTPAAAYTNKETVEQNLFGRKGLATLRRTTPTDTVEAYVEPIAPSAIEQDRFSYLYMLNAPAGFWQSTTQTVDSTSPVNNPGNAPVGDAVIDIVGGTNVVVTMTEDGATISIAGATPAGGVRVDLTAGTVTRITGGTDYHEFVSFGKPYHVILEPGDNPFSTAGTPSSVTFSFYPKYRT